MSLITRCPACETLFRVVPDQLRISQGWVRCGQCEEIFDASQHLQTPADAAQAVTPPPPSPPSSWLPPPPPPPELLLPDPSPLGGWAADPVDEVDLDEMGRDGPPRGAHASDEAVHAASEVASVHDEAPPAPDLGLIFPGDPPDTRPDGQAGYPGQVEPTFDLAAHLSHEADALAMPPEPAADPMPAQEPLSAFAEPTATGAVELPVPSPAAEDAVHTVAAAPASFGDALASAIEATQQASSAAAPGFAAELPPRADADDAPPAVSFMRSARRASAWHSTWVRVVLSLACGVLVLGLALQWVVQERDHIAAVQPQARPWLAMVCQPLGCAVRPLRQIEAMVIESSSFTKLRGDAYRLSFAIKNTATIALAVPAMELTLTDLQDQAVMRRVFAPADLGATSAVLAPGAEWVATLPVSLRANNPPDRIAGYRVLAFYP